MMGLDLDIPDQRNSWGTLITYTTQKEKEEVVEYLEEEIDNLQRRNIGDIEEFDPAIGVVNCVDISDKSEIVLSEPKAGKQVMGWVKTYKIVLLCKTWQWKLLQTRDGRWTSHLNSIQHKSDHPPIEKSAQHLLKEENISKNQSRLVIHEYLQQRDLFTEFLDEAGINPNRLQSIIDQKGLWNLSDSEKALLLRPNEELLRYIAAQELRERQGGRFARQDFVNLFGEIPRQIQSNSQIFEDILEEVTTKEGDIEQFSTIQVLAGILRLDTFEDQLEQAIRDTLAREPSDVLNRIEEVDRNQFLERSSYIAEFLESDPTRSIFSALLTAVNLDGISGGDPFLDILERYQMEVTSRDKAFVTRLLVEKIISGEYSSSKNHSVIADFLDEEGPKIVLLLDGLPLATHETAGFLSERKTDERWEIRQAIAPIPSVTEMFRSSLSSELDFDDLGGFTDGEDGLAGLDLDAFLGDEKEEELFEMLQNGDSVIIYNADIDQGARYPTDIHRKIDAHLRENIPEFIRKYGDHADILITSDHGMVETFESEAIPRPAEANQRGMSHCRGTFVDNVDAVRGELSDNKVSYIEVGLPDSDENCVMLNPNNPNAKFGTQSSDLWIHGGVSIEESVVPVAIWRGV
jgi:hypothetical protein